MLTRYDLLLPTLRFMLITIAFSQHLQWRLAAHLRLLLWFAGPFA